MIELLDEKYQDAYAVGLVQKKVNEIIKVLNDSCTDKEVENEEKT